jgi:hypothetical protein
LKYARTVITSMARELITGSSNVAGTEGLNLRVTIGRLDFEGTFLHLQDGNIKGASSEIVNHNGGEPSLNSKPS